MELSGMHWPLLEPPCLPVCLEVYAVIGILENARLCEGLVECSVGSGIHKTSSSTQPTGCLPLSPAQLHAATWGQASLRAAAPGFRCFSNHSCLLLALRVCQQCMGCVGGRSGCTVFEWWSVFCVMPIPAYRSSSLHCQCHRITLVLWCFDSVLASFWVGQVCTGGRSCCTNVNCRQCG